MRGQDAERALEVLRSIRDVLCWIAAGIAVLALITMSSCFTAAITGSLHP